MFQYHPLVAEVEEEYGASDSLFAAALEELAKFSIPNVACHNDRGMNTQTRTPANTPKAGDAGVTKTL